MIYSHIAGVGAYVPERVMDNNEIARIVETSDEWIRERSGIETRHIIADHESSATMATEAARKAIAAANIDKNDIELIICATTTPERMLPTNACLLQERLGINNQAAAFDVGAACAGFVYALSVADKFIKSGAVKTALIIGSEQLTRVVDWEDRSNCFLFADGAGAAILTAAEQPGVLSVEIFADGRYKDLLYISNDADLKNERDNKSRVIRMRGRDVFKVAVNTLEKLVEDAIVHNNIDQQEIDWLIPHQANLRIIKATAKKLNMPMEKVILTIDQHANTSAASIPLAMEQGIRDGRIKRGDLVLLEGFGGGFTWGAALIRY